MWRVNASTVYYFVTTGNPFLLLEDEDQPCRKNAIMGQNNSENVVWSLTFELLILCQSSGFLLCLLQVLGLANHRTATLRAQKAHRYTSMVHRELCCSQVCLVQVLHRPILMKWPPDHLGPIINFAVTGVTPKIRKFLLLDVSSMFGPSPGCEVPEWIPARDCHFPGGPELALSLGPGQ